MMRNVIGIDIGATNLRVALGNEEGRPVMVFSERTDGSRIMNQICSLADKFSDFEGIGIASVGPLNSYTGTILNPPNINIRNLKIAELLEGRYNVPCYLLNDCVASVIGERFLGAGKNVRNLVYVTLSTGIGCGAIVDDRVMLGKDGNAHEVGHCIVDINSKLRCGCGSYGHWEAYCGGKNMPKYAKYLLETEFQNEESTLRGVEITPEALFKLGRTDPTASRIVASIGRINAIEIANIINAYDPELVTIGGSIMLNNQEALMAQINVHTKNYIVNRPPKIMVTPLGDNIGLYGAIACVLQKDYLAAALGDVTKARNGRLLWQS